MLLVKTQASHHGFWRLSQSTMKMKSCMVQGPISLIFASALVCERSQILQMLFVCIPEPLQICERSKTLQQVGPCSCFLEIRFKRASVKPSTIIQWRRYKTRVILMHFCPSLEICVKIAVCTHVKLLNVLENKNGPCQGKIFWTFASGFGNAFVNIRKSANAIFVCCLHGAFADLRAFVNPLTNVQRALSTPDTTREAKQTGMQKNPL